MNGYGKRLFGVLTLTGLFVLGAVLFVSVNSLSDRLFGGADQSLPQPVPSFHCFGHRQPFH